MVMPVQANYFMQIYCQLFDEPDAAVLTRVFNNELIFLLISRMAGCPNLGQLSISGFANDRLEGRFAQCPPSVLK